MNKTGTMSLSGFSPLLLRRFPHASDTFGHFIEVDQRHAGQRGERVDVGGSRFIFLMRCLVAEVFDVVGPVSKSWCQTVFLGQKFNALRKDFSCWKITRLVFGRHLQSTSIGHACSEDVARYAASFCFQKRPFDIIRQIIRNIWRRARRRNFYYFTDICQIIFYSQVISNFLHGMSVVSDQGNSQHFLTSATEASYIYELPTISVNCKYRGQISSLIFTSTTRAIQDNCSHA